MPLHCCADMIKPCLSLPKPKHLADMSMEPGRRQIPHDCRPQGILNVRVRASWLPNSQPDQDTMTDISCLSLGNTQSLASSIEQVNGKLRSLPEPHTCISSLSCTSLTTISPTCMGHANTSQILLSSPAVQELWCMHAALCPLPLTATIAYVLDLSTCVCFRHSVCNPVFCD